MKAFPDTAVLMMTAHTEACCCTVCVPVMMCVSADLYDCHMHYSFPPEKMRAAVTVNMILSVNQTCSGYHVTVYPPADLNVCVLPATVYSDVPLFLPEVLTQV